MLNQRGIALIEIIVAMFITLVGFLGMMTVQIMSVSGTTVARNETAAMNLAQALVEKLARTSYSNAAFNTGLHSAAAGDSDVTGGLVRANPIFSNNSTASTGVPNVQFTRTWTVTDQTVNTQILKKVVVEVRWGEGTMGQKTRTLTFWKSQFY
ncbi:MAG: hypothetical protein HYS23_07380 [Geobacter sp.]|nr:hypothetical protein [Geobacter sp.]